MSLKTTGDDFLPYAIAKRPWIHGDRDAVGWMLRVERRRNIYDRLKQLGRLALLGLTSILTGYEDGEVEPLPELTNAKSVFKKSYMGRTAHRKTQKAVMALDGESYRRAEEGFQSFMTTVTLSIKDLDHRSTLSVFNDLKRWVFSHMTSDPAVDQTLDYLKWLLKACQMIFLGRTIPEPESWFPDLRGTFHPFTTGEFAFLAEFFEARRVTRRLSADEASLLVQMSNGLRSLPYPSRIQMQKSIDSNLKLLQEPKRISQQNRERYRMGLKQIHLRLGKPTDSTSHVSLTTSACIENPQSKGGKAAHMVNACKRFLCKPADAEAVASMEGLKDHLGFEPFRKGISAALREGCQYHDIVYLEPDEATRYLSELDMSRERVPYDYGKAVLLISSALLVERGLGSFDGTVENPLGLPLFKSKTRFRPKVDKLLTKGSLVQEKGMKTRLITTTFAPKAQVEQLFAHMVREYLAKDPFHRVGFDEPDKLWETLKRYKAFKEARTAQ